MIRQRHSAALVAFFVLVGVVFASVFPYVGVINNPNENTRTYTTMALVDDHTFRIDKEVADYGHVNDMARVPQKDGTSHLFQMKGPANAYAGVPVYWLLRKVATLFHVQVPGEVASHEARMAWLEAATFALRFFTVQIPCFAFLVWFERWLRRTTGDVVLRLSAVVAAGLGTNYLAYSLMFVSHALYAVATFVAFGVTVAEWEEHPLPARRTPWGAFVVGFCAGWAVLLDYQGLGTSVVMVIFALCIFRSAKSVLALLAGGGIHVVAMMIYQWRAFGNPLTPGHTFAESPAFRIEHNRGLYGIDIPDMHALVDLCFSRAFGFFGTSPFMWLAFLAIPFVVFETQGASSVRRKARVSSIVWMVAMAILFVSVTGKSNWHGGWTIGPRYYGAAPPFFAFGGVAALEAVARRSHPLRTLTRAVAVGLAMASALQTGLISIVENTLPEDITRPLAQAAIPLILSGFVPHHLLELFGWTSTAPFYFVLACFVAAVGFPLFLRSHEAVTAWGIRCVMAVALATCALVPALTVTSKEEAIRGTASVGWLTTIWEPAGRDAITLGHEQLAREAAVSPCEWKHLARMEVLVGREPQAQADEARAGNASKCPGLLDNLEDRLADRLLKNPASP